MNGRFCRNRVIRDAIDEGWEVIYASKAMPWQDAAMWESPHDLLRHDEYGYMLVAATENEDVALNLKAFNVARQIAMTRGLVVRLVGNPIDRRLAWDRTITPASIAARVSSGAVVHDGRLGDYILFRGRTGEVERE